MKTSSRRRALAGTISVLLLSVAACSDDGADGAEASSPSTTLEASATTAGEASTTTEGDTSGAASVSQLEERLDLAMAELVAMPGGPPGVVGVVQIDDEKTTHAAGVSN